MDAIVDGEVEIVDFDGVTPLYLRPNDSELLYRLLTKCKDCKNLTKKEKEEASWLVMQLEGVLQRQF